LLVFSFLFVCRHRSHTAGGDRRAGFRCCRRAALAVRAPLAVAASLASALAAVLALAAIAWMIEPVAGSADGEPPRPRRPRRIPGRRIEAAVHGVGDEPFAPLNFVGLLVGSRAGRESWCARDRAITPAGRAVHAGALLVCAVQARSANNIRGRPLFGVALVVTLYEESGRGRLSSWRGHTARVAQWVPARQALARRGQHLDGGASCGSC